MLRFSNWNLRAAALGALLALGASAEASPSNAVPEDLRLLIVERINRDRAWAGAPPVAYDAELSRAADRHCEDMLRGNYSSHWNREGWKPYLRYSHAGIRHATSENVASYWCTNCNFNLQKLRGEALASHERFMAETPPNDGHRRSILDPTHTHVGIGLAFGPEGFRMIELFSARYADLDELPLRAKVNQNFRVTGRVFARDFSLMAVSVFYEPLPRPMSAAELRASYAYGLPDEERIERPSLAGTFRKYSDGTMGTVRMGAGGSFEVPLMFWKQQPGVYTVAIWVRREREPAFIAATSSILVE